VNGSGPVHLTPRRRCEARATDRRGHDRPVRWPRGGREF
jgi:hypothetical protein